MSKKKGLKRGTPQYKNHVERILQRREEDHQVQRDVARQMSVDALILAIHDTCGFGKVRVKRLVDAWVDKSHEMGRSLNADYADDEHMTYAKAKIDEALLRIVGEENFTPWEERYSFVSE